MNTISIDLYMSIYCGPTSCVARIFLMGGLNLHDLDLNLKAWPKVLTDEKGDNFVDKFNKSHSKLSIIFSISVIILIVQHAC